MITSVKTQVVKLLPAQLANEENNLIQSHYFPDDISDWLGKGICHITA
jgi:hypothetical protein